MSGPIKPVALVLALLVACADNGPHQFLCHETSVCDGVPSDEGEWSVCLADADTYVRDGVEQCIGFLIGWCTSYWCRIECAPEGECALDAATARD